MAIIPAVLIALDQDRLAARDEEPGGRVAREVAVQVRGRALVVVLEDRLRGRAPQPRRSVGAPHEAALEHLVELAVGPDEEGNAEERRAIAGREAVARPILFGVRPVRREPRRRPHQARRLGDDALARTRCGASADDDREQARGAEPTLELRARHGGRDGSTLTTIVGAAAVSSGSRFPREERP